MEQRQHGLQSWLNEVLRAYACDPHIAEFLLPPEADATVTKTSTAAVDFSADSLGHQHQHDKETTTELQSSDGQFQLAEAAADVPNASDDDTDANRLDHQVRLKLLRRKWLPSRLSSEPSDIDT